MSKHMNAYDRLCLLSGNPLQRGHIKIHFPTIDEIVAMTYEAYNSMMVIFMTNMKDLYQGSGIPEELLNELNFLDVALRQEGEFQEIATRVVQTYFKQEVTDELFIGEAGLQIQGQPLTNELWDSIRFLILEANDLNAESEVEPAFTNEKAKEIWLKQKKAEEMRNKVKNKGGETFEDLLCDIISSVCSKSHSVTYLNVGALNVFQLKDHLGKLIEIEAYDLNMMFAAHGAEIKDNKHWSESKSDTNGGK